MSIVYNSTYSIFYFHIFRVLYLENRTENKPFNALGIMHFLLKQLEELFQQIRSTIDACCDVKDYNRKNSITLTQQTSFCLYGNYNNTICEKSPDEIPPEIRRKLFSTEVTFENAMENTDDPDFDSNNIEEEYDDDDHKVEKYSSKKGVGRTRETSNNTTIDDPDFDPNQIDQEDKNDQDCNTGKDSVKRKSPKKSGRSRQRFSQCDKCLKSWGKNITEFKKENS